MNVPETNILRASLRPRETMHIGVLTLHLSIEAADSLKDKRQVGKSLKDRLRDRFNVAVAEIADQDLWQRGVVAAVTVASSRAVAEETAERVEREAVHLLGAMVVRADVEWL